MDKDKNNLLMVAVVAAVAIFAIMLFARGNLGQATAQVGSSVYLTNPDATPPQFQRLPIDANFDGTVEGSVDIPIYISYGTTP